MVVVQVEKVFGYYYDLFVCCCCGFCVGGVVDIVEGEDFVMVDMLQGCWVDFVLVGCVVQVVGGDEGWWQLWWYYVQQVEVFFCQIGVVVGVFYFELGFVCCVVDFYQVGIECQFG